MFDLSTAEADGNVSSLVFGHKPKYWTHWNFDQMVTLDEKSGEKNYYKSSSGGHECQYKMLFDHP